MAHHRDPITAEAAARETAKLAGGVEEALGAFERGDFARGKNALENVDYQLRYLLKGARATVRAERRQAAKALRVRS
jgi:hypothetical protein